MSVNTMRFNDLMLQQALEQWRQMNAPKERAAADNFWFEERVSTTRQQAFEQEASGAENPDVLRRRHADYWGDFVRVDHETPHTFLADLEPVDLGTIDETQPLKFRRRSRHALQKISGPNLGQRSAGLPPVHAQREEARVGNLQCAHMRLAVLLQGDVGKEVHRLFHPTLQESQETS